VRGTIPCQYSFTALQVHCLTPAKKTEMAVLNSDPFNPKDSSMPWTRALDNAFRSR